MRSRQPTSNERLSARTHHDRSVGRSGVLRRSHLEGVEQMHWLALEILRASIEAIVGLAGLAFSLCILWFVFRMIEE